jgi:rhamnulokinase
MSQARNYLAIDLGADSGRAILGRLDGERLSLTETHRFPNGPVSLPGGLHWDVLRLWAQIKAGIAATVKGGVQLDSLGLDTWGVDFALLDRDGVLLGNPFHYRDTRTNGILEEAFRVMSREDIFACTGVQFMPFNSLFQLLAMVRAGSPVLEIAQTFVTIPDLFNYWLSGEIANEFTNATTTQCFNPLMGDWALPALDALHIPKHLFHPVTAPGTSLGMLLPDVAAETGAGDVQVVLPACHDTGSAVVAVPAKNQDFAWISSGTWSIMGAEVLEPVVGPKALQYNFTNEGGVFGTWRLSKNINGLWLVQECRREWQRQGEDFSYDVLTQMAAEAEAFTAVIDPDDAAFLPPGDMPENIRGYCARTGQHIPQTKGEVLRVALEGIALRYRWTLERLEELSEKRLDPLHIIGGGTKNRLLNQFAADSTGRTVVTGPVEATATGNVLMQAVGLGQLGTLADARTVVRNSFEVESYHPGSREGWGEAYAKFLQLLETQSV